MNQKKSKRGSSNESNSDSDNNSSSPRKRSSSKRRKSPDRGRKPHRKCSDSEEDKSSKVVEHSKWDSPDTKNKRQRAEVHRSYSRDRDQHRDRHNRDDRHKRESRPNQAYDRRNDRRQESNRYHDRRNDREDRYRRDNKNFHNDRQQERRGDKRRRSRSTSFDHSKATWGRNEPKANETKEKNVNKEKPNFGLSGKLTEETNTYKGVVIKYSEPPEARKPKRRWRLYPFKGEKAMQTLYIHRESAYLIGRDRKVVDLPVDHPSCSKQHAALQYRLVPFTREDGSTGKRVRPYIIDLESANGTFLNNKKIEPKKYIELLEKDVLKFGFSSREYVLLHENSKDDAMDDDVKMEEVEVKNERED